MLLDKILYDIHTDEIMQKSILENYNYNKERTSLNSYEYKINIITKNIQIHQDLIVHYSINYTISDIFHLGSLKINHIELLKAHKNTTINIPLCDIITYNILKESKNEIYTIYYKNKYELPSYITMILVKPLLDLLLTLLYKYNIESYEQLKLLGIIQY